MTALLLVSHLKEVADSVGKLARTLAGDDVTILTAGGEMGIDLSRLQDAMRTLAMGDTVVALGDMGSSMILLDELAQVVREQRVMVADAPFVEGAVAAAMALALKAPAEEVLTRAEEAYAIHKR